MSKRKFNPALAGGLAGGFGRPATNRVPAQGSASFSPPKVNSQSTAHIPSTAPIYGPLPGLDTPQITPKPGGLLDKTVNGLIGVGTGMQAGYDKLKGAVGSLAVPPVHSGGSAGSYIPGAPPSAPGPSSEPVSSYVEADLAKEYNMSNTVAYQEALSNTAIRRRMADLKAAGLNPILAMGNVGGAGGVQYINDQTPASGSYSSGGGSASGSRRNNGRQLLDTIGTGIAAAAGFKLSGGNVMAASMAANSAHGFLEGVGKLFK